MGKSVVLVCPLFLVEYEFEMVLFVGEQKNYSLPYW